MKRISLLMCVIVLAVFMTPGQAQSQEEMQKWMEYMTPSDVHKMLAKSDGEWVEEIQMWMDPDAPAQTMQASCVNKMIMGGRYQESINTGSFNGMPFEGRSVTGWDNARKVFVATWIDNMGTGISYMEGPWDEATRSMILKGKMTDPMTGEMTDIKQVFKIINDDTHVMEQYGMKDGKEYKSMVITFTRKK